MMPVYDTEYTWRKHRQKYSSRDGFGRPTPRFHLRQGRSLHNWLFGWVFYYTCGSSKYPAEVEPKFEPWRDLLSLLTVPS